MIQNSQAKKINFKLKIIFYQISDAFLMLLLKTIVKMEYKNFKKDMVKE